jgi:site-specific recombinase XerD
VIVLDDGHFVLESECQDPGLRGLVAGLPGLLQNSRAPSTVKSYKAAFTRWQTWTRRYPEVCCLPASELHVVLYLSQLGIEGISYQVIIQAIAAIKWFHSLEGLASPTEGVLVKEVLHSLRRKLARPTVRKEPLKLEHIHEICNVVNLDCITDVRNSTIIVLSFFALFRSDELRNVLLQDIELHSTHVSINIRSSKCDQLRNGSVVLVARLGGKFCPVALLERYLAITRQLEVETSSKAYLFRRIICTKFGKTLGVETMPMTYTNLRDMLQQKLCQIGLDAASFGTHSMRAGGATMAANNNISDRLLQRHGRWAGPSSANRYLEDDLDQRLKVSQRIGNQ